jgi:hypothetical protein
VDKVWRRAASVVKGGKPAEPERGRSECDIIVGGEQRPATAGSPFSVLPLCCLLVCSIDWI